VCNFFNDSTLIVDNQQTCETALQRQPLGLGNHSIEGKPISEAEKTYFYFLPIKKIPATAEEK